MATFHLFFQSVRAKNLSAPLFISSTRNATCSDVRSQQLNFVGKIAQGDNGILRYLLEFTVFALEIRECGEQKMQLGKERVFQIFFYLKQTIRVFNINIYQH